MNIETDSKNIETDNKKVQGQNQQVSTAAHELQKQLINQKEAKKQSFTRSSDVSIASKKSKRHSKLSNNRNSRTFSSGNERAQKEKTSNGRLSIPFVQEEEKPLAIVKESSKDTKIVEDEHEPEIAKNLDDTPLKLPSGIHNNAILEIEQAADPSQFLGQNI